jgi:hypothetical protein
MQFTVRVYKDVAAFPGLYKWDYEANNVSINSDHPDSYVNGVGAIGIRVAGVTDVANVYSPTNWESHLYAGGDPTDVSITSGYAPDPDEQDYDQQIYALRPGQTIHFGFTTFPRQMAERQACTLDDDGFIVDADYPRCSSAYKTDTGHPEIVFQPPSEASHQAPPGRSAPGMSALNARKSAAGLRLARAVRAHPQDSSACILLNTAHQEWWWDIYHHSGQAPDQPHYGQVDLPRNNCPASEMQ